MVAAIIACSLIQPQIPKYESAWRYAQERGANAMVVLVDGKTVFETGRVNNSNQILASGTKSFCAVAIACAIQDGAIKGWDDKVSDSITEWKSDARKSITYRHLLSLSSGLVDGPQSENLTCPTEKELVATQLRGIPGNRFKYGPRPFCVLSLALERKLKGEKIQDYLERRVFKVLGISVSYKNINDEGRAQMAGMGRCSPRDWAKFGELVRLNGKYQGKQLWDANAFSETAKSHGPGDAYGLAFWLSGEPSILTGDGPKPSVSGVQLAAGAGKQLNIIIPTERMVVVRTGIGKGRQGEFKGDEFIELILGKR